MDMSAAFARAFPAIPNAEGSEQIVEPAALAHPRPETPPALVRKTCDELLLVHEADVIGESARLDTDVPEFLHCSLVEKYTAVQCEAHLVE